MHIKRILTSLVLPVFLLVFATGCDKENPGAPTLDLIGLSVNGSTLSDGAMNVATTATFQLVFSTAIDPTRFPAAFSLRAANGALPGVSFSYTNASSKVSVTTTLQTGTSYTLRVEASVIGQNGGQLATPISRQFTTQDGTITEQAPCISGSADCLLQLSLSAPNGNQGNFDCYTSFPFDLEMARWERLRYAVITVHGQNRNADEYFNWMMTTLRNEGLEEDGVLISPYFKPTSEAQGNDIYWPSNNWREGQGSAGPAGISSFAVVDQIIAMLADATHFPVMEKIIVAGHSSGALFTHVYAAANQAQPQYPQLEFRYVVANSQYFYYPDDVRYDSGTGQFVTPTGCLDFNYWPLGFNQVPPYLASVTANTVDQQFISRQVTYLLGTADTVTSGTLNTADCGPVLLGENRYERGQNMFNFLETYYAGTHQHQRVIVPGIGHDAQGMFQSAPFLNWLRAEL
ncbi:MAG: Ig-like domain-containing protein [Lewinella sp.]|nr:Ig-like domain-containing protein [Lewinella sp.]